ncbi:MAG: hypothetical protein HYT12_05000 [Candidatus Liptonbacteria bacterium]|nr:hypothetical protein [Candidatus Liptonbacteria bacterium]
MKDKEDREKAVEKFFNLQKKALYDIIPKGKDRVVDLPSESNGDGANAVAGSAGKQFSARHGSSRRISYYRKGHWKKWLMVFAVVLIFAASAAYAAVVLPTANINLTLKQTPKSFNGQIRAAVGSGDIPLQVFSETKNVQLAFPASGKEKVARKAHGIISVCNAFSGNPQQLVATTRFETPQGIIFRLDKGMTVPGALIKDGKIAPQCVSATVSSDKAGIGYNIGPVPKWTVPGFKGSSRYAGFYGMSEKPMSGGFVGEAAVPTRQDLDNAKAEARKKIEDIIVTAIEVRAPKNLTVLQSDSGFVITKETVITDTDDEGNFHYFIEARDERIAVRKSDMEDFFVKQFEDELGRGAKLASSTIDFTLKSKKTDVSGATKEAVFDVSAKGGFVGDISEESVRSKAAGKSEPELRDVFAGGDIAGAKISFWPFWVKSVPKKLHKINVKIDIAPLNLEDDKDDVE